MRVMGTRRVERLAQLHHHPHHVSGREADGVPVVGSQNFEVTTCKLQATSCELKVTSYRQPAREADGVREQLTGHAVAGADGDAEAGAQPRAEEGGDSEDNDDDLWTCTLSISVAK